MSAALNPLQQAAAKLLNEALRLAANTDLLRHIDVSKDTLTEFVDAVSELAE